MSDAQAAMRAARRQASRAKDVLDQELQAAVAAKDAALVASLTTKYLRAAKLEVEARNREISATLNSNGPANEASLVAATKVLKGEIDRQKAGENRLNAVAAGVNALLSVVLLFSL